MKKIKAPKQAHTDNSKIPRPNEMGTGIKQKVGKSLSNSMNFHSIGKKGIKTPPKSLA